MTLSCGVKARVGDNEVKRLEFGDRQGPWREEKGSQAQSRLMTWAVGGQERKGRLVGPPGKMEDSGGEDAVPPAPSPPHIMTDVKHSPDGHMPLLTRFSATKPGQGPCWPLQPQATSSFPLFQTLDCRPNSHSQTPGAGPLHSLCASCSSRLWCLLLREASEIPSQCQIPLSYPWRNSGPCPSCAIVV